MTISSEDRKAGPFIGNGSTTVFPFTFKVFEAGDIVVTHSNTDGVEQVLDYGVHYSVTLNVNQDTYPGGEVTIIGEAPGVGEKLSITSGIPSLQPLQIQNLGGFYPTVLNAALDRLTILIQQLAEQVGRSIKVPVNSIADATPDALMAELQSQVESASVHSVSASGFADAAQSYALDAQSFAFDAQAAATLTIGGYRARNINGDFRIGQYGTYAVNVPTGAAEVHVIDGWTYINGCAAGLRVSRVDNVTAPDGSILNWLTVSVTTADPSISANDYSFLVTKIEGYEVGDLVGNTFVLHGYVKSSVSGVHSVEMRNGATDRYYLGEINVSTPDAPQYFQVVVDGGLPNSGTWDFGRGVGLEVGFVLAAGSNNTGTVGSWVSGSEISSTNQVNAVGTVGNVFGVANVQIEPGGVPLPFERLSIETSLSRCQRRYRSVPFFMSGYGTAGSRVSQTIAFGPALRTDLVSPSQPNPLFTNCSATALTSLSGGSGTCSGFVRSVTVTATGSFSHEGIVILDARL